MSTIWSCNKLVEVDTPVTTISNESVFSSDANAIAAVTGLYVAAAGSQFYELTSRLGLLADEYSLASQGNPSYAAYYTNNLSPVNYGTEFWALYNPIYRANEAIDRITAATTLTSKIKQQLIGECKFMRALYYFYLINLYGDVPLILSTDYDLSSRFSRTPQADVLKQIKLDLSDAYTMLSSDYLDQTLIATTTERLRPTKWAAAALLSRLFLYSGQWTDAENQASLLINNTMFSLSSLSTTFKTVGPGGNKEAIWQIQPINSPWVPEATLFILPTSGPSLSQPIYLRPSLMNEFETGDMRKTNWVGNVTTSSGATYYYPFKYKIKAATTPALQEYIMMFRLAEQYLIRAEARAQQNKLTESIADLNIVRNRAGLGNVITGPNQQNLLNIIYHERQIEFFSELGHRWFDLKRTGNLDAVMATIAPTKGGTWMPFKQLFPIPNTDIQADVNLRQNSGY